MDNRLLRCPIDTNLCDETGAAPLGTTRVVYASEPSQQDASDHNRGVDQYLVYGLTRSYFTRKVTGYLDYTDRPWRLERGINNHPAATAAGWNGGIPVVTNPAGEFLWDSTTIIEHLELSTPGDASVLPADPALRFLAYLLDDFSDEWFYRPAVGSRWSYPANTDAASWQVTEELSSGIPVPAQFLREQVIETMQGSLGKLGVNEDNIDAWMSDVLVPWMQVLDTHFASTDYLLGDRPSIADFALFGANAAHFVADPYCRELADEHGSGMVAHTYRLLHPHQQTFGPWLDADSIPDSLVAVLAEAGRHYLPWVSRATVDGSAIVEFADGVTADITSTPFLETARGVMLARYVEARTPALDAVLERAGILRHFADHVDRATIVPDVASAARPADNRPYAIN